MIKEINNKEKILLQTLKNRVRMGVGIILPNAHPPKFPLGGIIRLKFGFQSSL